MSVSNNVHKLMFWIVYMYVIVRPTTHNW